MKCPPSACVVVFIMIPEVMNMNIILYMYLVAVRDSYIQLYSVQCTCTCSYCCLVVVQSIHCTHVQDVLSTCLYMYSTVGVFH